MSALFQIFGQIFAFNVADPRLGIYVIALVVPLFLIYVIAQALQAPKKTLGIVAVSSVFFLGYWALVMYLASLG
jgi:hypothetical protein